MRLRGSDRSDEESNSLYLVYIYWKIHYSPNIILSNLKPYERTWTRSLLGFRDRYSLRCCDVFTLLHLSIPAAASPTWTNTVFLHLFYGKILLPIPISSPLFIL
ncbi:hypothetical protein EVAR_15732_1 [Eumeta japonica]|uniref:Uncharacterized protein n=1 Tax=Eumeta variegata TaxID=151549 RepID=A0A4C1UAG4_EUMVA|nr:hypothetical protein EVAR_15732_1 [Eumeta japonica]